jgi:hypothetical protein
MGKYYKGLGGEGGFFSAESNPLALLDVTSTMQKTVSMTIWLQFASTRIDSQLRFERLHAILQLMKCHHFLRGQFAVEHSEVVKQANIVHT